MIGAVSSHFCDICNRLRLTAEGHIRSCLFSDRETDIKTPLREGKGDDTLLELLDKAIAKKSNNPGVLKLGPRKCVRQMSSIGG
jgi:cyclic pyranopterin phosphate synthase